MKAFLPLSFKIVKALGGFRVSAPVLYERMKNWLCFFGRHKWCGFRWRNWVCSGSCLREEYLAAAAIDNCSCCSSSDLMLLFFWPHIWKVGEKVLTEGSVETILCISSISKKLFYVPNKIILKFTELHIIWSFLLNYYCDFRASNFCSALIMLYQKTQNLNLILNSVW